MRGGNRIKCILIVFLVLVLSSISPSPALAGKASYFYDDLGRLIKVINDAGQTAIYQYDEVGNLLSITSTATEASPPELSSVSPGALFTHTEAVISFAGGHLLAVESLMADNANVSINTFSSTESGIAAYVTITDYEPDGPVGFTATSPFGSDTIYVNIFHVVLGSTQLIVAPGGSESVSVSTVPKASGNIGLTVSGSSAAFMVPAGVVVGPEGGSITVTGVSEGNGTFDAGGQTASVFVSEPFTGAATVASGGVSIGPGQAQSGMSFSSVSIGLGQVQSAMGFAPPVSVQNGSAPSGMCISQPVSTGFMSQ